MSVWWKRNKKKVPLHDENFRKIVIFFVFECPVQFKDGKRVSARAKTFEDCSIVENQLTLLLNQLKRKIEHKDCYRCCKNSEELETFEANCRSKYPKEAHVEVVSFINNPELYTTRTLFYAIRNAIAHGSFSIVEAKNGERFYYFETSKNTVLKARMCFREKTLLQWIDITKSMMK